MKEAGTHADCFEDVIDTLASILEERDRAMEAFEESGGEVIVEHTNKGGATNIEQNPALRLINSLNMDALAYWRDLGLTPKGLKAINDSAIKQKDGDAFISALEKLGV